MIEQHKTLSEKFLKKGVWLYLFSFIIAPIGYIIKIIISSELSVSDVGILYGVISLITLVSAYNDLGMSESINYFVPKFVTQNRYDKVKSILAYAFIAQMLSGIILASFFFFGANFLSNNYFNSPNAINILKVFAFYFLGINITQILSVFFLSIQNTFAKKIIEFIRMFFCLLSIVFVYVFDYSSLVNYSITWIIGLYLSIIFAIIFFYKKYYNKYFKKEKIIWKKKLFLPIFKYGSMVFLGASAGSILSQIDMQMVIYILGTTDAGYYTNYLSIIGIPFLIIGPIFSLLFPIFSEMYGKKEFSKIKLVKKIFYKNFFAIGIAFNILFFIFAEKISFVLFGEKFIESGHILKYSILFLIFNFLLQINFNIMAGIGKVKERVKIIFIALIFNTIGNIILINLIGVEGAALATALGWILIWGLSEINLGKKYFVKFDYKFLIKNIVFMGLLGLICYNVTFIFFEGLSRINSFLLLLLIGIIWFSIFTLLNYKEFKFFILEIKKLRKG